MKSKSIAKHTPTRYLVVSKYLNNQTPEGWDALASYVIMDSPKIVRACNSHEGMLDVLKDIKAFYEAYGKDGDIPGSEAVDFLWKIYGDAKAVISKIEGRGE